MRSILILILVYLPTVLLVPVEAELIITTVAGGGTPNNVPGTNASIGSPSTVTADKAGNVFFTISKLHIVTKVDAETGMLTIVAGTGSKGFSGDQGLASNAKLNYPVDVAVDKTGNLFIADSGNSRVRRVDAVTHRITSVTGNGTSSSSVDQGLATVARLASVHRIETDKADNLFIVEFSKNRIRRVNTTSGIITTVVGTGKFGISGDGGPATEAQLTYPWDVATDNKGNLFIVTSNRIRRIDKETGLISTVAGTGKLGPLNDGRSAQSAGFSPKGIALDKAGNLFIADHTRIRRVDALTNIITTLIGPHITEAPDTQHPDGTRFLHARDVSMDDAGNLFIAGRHKIRRLDAVTGILAPIAGNGFASFYGDGGPALISQLSHPSDLVTDTSGHIFFTDGKNQRIRRIDANTGLITTVVGGGTQYSPGVRIPATDALLGKPASLAIDKMNNIFIADKCSPYILKVDEKTKNISTLPKFRFSNTSRQLKKVRSNNSCRYNRKLAIDKKGNLYVMSPDSHQIQRFDISTNRFYRVAGNGTEGFSGDDQYASDAQLAYPHDLAFDNEGNLYIADTGNARIRRVDAGTGRISTVAGNGIRGSSGDGGPATVAELALPHSLAIENTGNLLITDTHKSQIRRIDIKTGIIVTIAGNGEHKLSGDGGSATTAGLGGILRIAADHTGRIFIATEDRIRMISDPDIHSDFGMDRNGNN